MWDSPHEGIAVIHLLGRDMRIRFDWAALSRIEFHYQGKEDLNNPVHLSEVLSQGLETFHPGEVSAKQVMSARLPVVYLAKRVKDAFAYSLGSHPTLKGEPSASETAPDEGKKKNRITEAYRTASKVGVSDSEFWRLTPYQTSLRIQVFNEKHAEEVRHDLWRAWHTGAFSREDHKFPKYESLFPPAMPKTPPNETPRERGLRLRAELMAAYPPRNLQ